MWTSIKWWITVWAAAFTAFTTHIWSPIFDADNTMSLAFKEICVEKCCFVFKVSYCLSQFNCPKREISCIHCHRVSLNSVLWRLSGKHHQSDAWVWHVKAWKMGRLGRNEERAAWSMITTDTCQVQPKQNLVEEEEKKCAAPTCLRVCLNKFPW